MRKQLRRQIQEVIAPAARHVPRLRTDRGRQVDHAVRLPERASTRHETTSSRSKTRSNTRWTSVTQIEINTKAGQTFAGSLRSVLRQDPDVVMIGEIRDEETAKIACQAANTGHMVFSTVHANDTITALYRLLDLGVEPFMLARRRSRPFSASGWRGGCARTATRRTSPTRNCSRRPACRPRRSTSSTGRRRSARKTCTALRRHGLPRPDRRVRTAGDQRPHARPDPRKGRRLGHEAEARKNGMLYMREEGLRLVVRGVTSIDELMRVVK